MQPLRPAATYYTACHGHWQGWLDTSFESDALRHSPLGVLERWSIRLMRLCPWRWRIRTSVNADAVDTDGLVRHTTWIGRFGVPMFVSTEELRVDADGRHIDMTVTAWRFPGVRQTLQSRALVADDAMSVSYDIEWLGGTTLQQQGVRTDQGVTLAQSRPAGQGSSGEHASPTPSMSPSSASAVSGCTVVSATSGEVLFGDVSFEVVLSTGCASASALSGSTVESGAPAESESASSPLIDVSTGLTSSASDTSAESVSS